MTHWPTALTRTHLLFGHAFYLQKQRQTIGAEPMGDGRDRLHRHLILINFFAAAERDQFRISASGLTLMQVG